MSALVSDVLGAAVTPRILNAACNAGGKLIKVFELRQKYGQPAGKGKTLPLKLANKAA